jgi:nitroreductase
MALAAASSRLGACILMKFDRNMIREALGAPAGFLPLLLVALGEPAEEVVLETVGEDGSVEYWRDGEGVHHVPKRSIGDLIVT